MRTGKSEHTSKLRELALRQLYCHANVPRLSDRRVSKLLFDCSLEKMLAFSYAIYYNREEISV